MSRVDRIHMANILVRKNLQHIVRRNHQRNLACMDIYHSMIHNNNRQCHSNYIHMVDNLDSRNDRRNKKNSWVVEIPFDIHIDLSLLHSFQLNRSCHNRNLKTAIKLDIYNHKALSEKCRIFVKLTFAHISFIPVFTVWSIELRLTFVTIDTLCVVLAIVANTTTFIIITNIQ